MNRYLILVFMLIACKNGSAANLKEESSEIKPSTRSYTLCTVSANRNSDIVTIGLTLPPAQPGSKMQETVSQTARVYLGRADKATSSFIDQGLDLYDRAGNLSRVSGGIFGPAPDYKPTVTVVVVLNPMTEGKTGFAELQFNGAPEKTVLELTCERQQREADTTNPQ